jgi:hypothetical protein
VNLEDFLVKDYELKVDFLSKQYERMWFRFNFFVSIELALFGGKFVIPNVNDTAAGKLILPVGTALSLIW